MYFVVAEGRRGGMPGLTLAQLMPGPLAAQLASELFVPEGTVMVIVADGAYARGEFVGALLAVVLLLLGKDRHQHAPMQAASSVTRRRRQR